MTFYSYILARDYGFAPNPFFGICTLATCKPTIRKKAKVGDWVLGTGSKCVGDNLLIYCMKVSEKLTFDEYWDDYRFQVKKPVRNGSAIKQYGDNIYHSSNGIWKQSDSHHSYGDGSTNNENLGKDIKGEYVLISNFFFILALKELKSLIR